MPKFSQKSLEQLATCDKRLQDVFNEVIKYVDCTVLEGHRGQELQDRYFREGTSKKQWPHGEHNKLPSCAVDVMLYPIDWTKEGLTKQCHFAGFVLGIATKMGVPLTWGGDWDNDFNLKEHTLFDTPHFQLKEN